MRQIGNDLRTDPREPIVTKAIDDADLSNEVNLEAYQQYTWNKFSEMSHKFCGKALNFSSGSSSDTEQDRFKTCMSKYSQAFNLFKEE